MYQSVVSFTDEQLIDSNTLQYVLAKAKPSSAKGTYFKSVAVTIMGSCS